MIMDDDRSKTLPISLAQGEALATQAYRIALQRHLVLGDHLGEILWHHEEASFVCPGANDHFPPLDGWVWQRLVNSLDAGSDLNKPVHACALLLMAEEQWLKLLHRWLISMLDSGQRSLLDPNLLERQWRNRNLCLHTALKLRGKSSVRIHRRSIKAPSTH